MRYEESGAYGDLERAVIRFAEELTRRAAVSDETFRAVRERLDDQELTELVVGIAFANMTNRIAHALDLEPEA